MNHERATSFTSPIGRGIGRLWRPFLEGTPKQSFGYVASKDAIRVRGYDLTMDLNPSPQPSPYGRGGALPLPQYSISNFE